MGCYWIEESVKHGDRCMHHHSCAIYEPDSRSISILSNNLSNENACRMMIAAKASASLAMQATCV